MTLSVPVDGHDEIQEVLLEDCDYTTADYRAKPFDAQQFEIDAEIDRATAMQVMAKMPELASVDFEQLDSVEAKI